jgi:hypothetical protein
MKDVGRGSIQPSAFAFASARMRRKPSARSCSGIIHAGWGQGAAAVPAPLVNRSLECGALPSQSPNCVRRKSVSL